MRHHDTRPDAASLDAAPGGAAPSVRPPSASPRPVRELSRLGLLVLVAGQLMTQLDFSIVNVALDRIGASLGTTPIGLVLVVAGYGLTFATLLGAGGRLGDRYGRKRLFLAGVAGFCVASLVCASASALLPMLVGRLLQGAFGAMMLPQILATIHAALDGPRHSRAVGVYTAVAGLSVVIGQVLGGWLVSADVLGLGWRLGFLVNLPVCLLVLVVGAVVIPDTRAGGAPGADRAGTTLFAVVLVSVLVPVSLGPDWPAARWLLLALPLAAFALWRVESRQERAGGSPLLPPSLLRDRTARTGLVAEAAVTFGYAGYLFVTALCVQSALGFSPLRSGSGFVGLGVLFFVGSLLSKPLGARLGDDRAYALGALLTVSGLVLTATLIAALGRGLTVGLLVAASGLVGAGNALMLTSAYRIALSRVAVRHAGPASVALTTVQQGCFALGTAFAGTVYAGLLGHGAATAFTGAVLALSVVLAGVVGLVVVHGRRVTRRLGRRSVAGDAAAPAPAAAQVRCSAVSQAAGTSE